MVIMPAFLYCMCFWGVFLQSQPVSTVDETKFDLGVRSREQVNGFEFGPISMISTVVSNATHAADDLLIPGNIVMSIGGVLRSYSPKTGILYPVESGTNQSPFQNIQGFLQTSTSEILVVDFSNNCIGLVVRQKVDFIIPTLAGMCGEPNGYKDGNALDSRFAYPRKIKDSPTSNIFYVTEPARHLRQFNTIEKTVTTLFKYHHEVLDVTLSASKKILYVGTICGILAYDISTETLQQLRPGDNCGFNDGKLHTEARFASPYSILLLDAFTILLADFHWNNLRVIDLCTNRTSTICIPTIDNSTFLVSEEPTTCSLTNPHTLIFSSVLKAVIVLSFQNSAILPIKYEDFHCDPYLPIPEDKTLQHNVAIQLRSEHVNFLLIPANERRKLHYECSQVTSEYENMCLVAWCVTAAEDENIELIFDSLSLPDGAELMIYDGMLVEDQLLILTMDKSNADQHINTTVLSTGNHITFVFFKELPAPKSGFNLHYNTKGYIPPIEPSAAATNLDENEHSDTKTSTGITNVAIAVIVVIISVVLTYLLLWRSVRQTEIADQLFNSGGGNARIHGDLPSDEPNISGHDEGDQSDTTTNDLGRDSGESNEFNSTDDQKPITKSGRDDRYHNLKLKNTLADNNIDPVQNASPMDINLQLDENKKCNIDYKKEKVIPKFAN